ncbi:hypothetical protein POSPLADRAFT_1147923 [Postia placenta MAD-698-R-SB12]|uniref:SH3 domain-containing protein n=1 Tax=Postia placenta MAD-698-R-SB12 TaxID=670580 RepID=A0A1X6MVU2_9APHY|nr:hypothetical protein POSPLADRAFT_1147923 [Postia placenta MAD-698-R-SB12]OSX60494.1 hypothetical protein POSPLADRAFT_1147923 [Postia placenta MAD-698-R-SB12]
MVFANLSAHEKDAFFSLLDEYFSARPDLLASGVTPEAGHAAAASALQSAFSKTSPKDVASAVNAASGFRRAIPPPAAPVSTGPLREIEPSFGRVAAAAAAFSSPITAQGPRPPARSKPTGLQEEKVSIPRAHKFGDVDISSGKAMFSSLRNSTANKTATPPPVAPPTPPAFASRKNNLGAPPPVRRVNSATSIASRAETAPSPPPPPPPRPHQEPEGDWAEVVYDYSSEDPGDLEIKEGERVLIVERTSDDWWTGELDGRRGLVPAAYVKLI